MVLMQAAGCRLQACSLEISLSACMPPTWDCEGAQASGTLAEDLGAEGCRQ